MEGEVTVGEQRGGSLEGGEGVLPGVGEPETPSCEGVAKGTGHLERLAGADAEDMDENGVHEHLGAEDRPLGDARHAYVAEMERQLFGE